MKKQLNISIPKPCHEDWSKMTQNEKGRFCNSCAKTVVDFTQKTIPEIQEYLIENRHKKVCGHFYKKQLDSITIEIPEHVLHQQLSFSKLFLLVLLVTMGTTLLSCNNDNGKKQKIENVIVTDSLNTTTKDVDSIEIPFIKSSKNDSLKIPIVPPKINEIMTIEGEMTLGIIEMPSKRKIDNIVEEEIVFGMINQEPPKFWGTKESPSHKLKKTFSDSIVKFISVNFDIEKAKKLSLSKGKHKIWAQFSIDKNGSVTDIIARGTHEKLEQHAIEILEKLPKLISGKQRGKPVKVKYTLPITFEIE